MPPCDLLLIAGDWSPPDHLLDAFLRTIPAGEIVAIAGNHDFIAEENEADVRAMPWTYLQDEAVVVDGVTIYGAPWSNRFFSWAFMAEEDELREHWSKIPDDVDVLITHGPAWGYGDLVTRGERVGSTALATRLRELRSLKLHVCGHIHEDSGVWIDDRGVVHANASFVNLNYRPAHPVLVFDYLDGKVVPVV